MRRSHLFGSLLGVALLAGAATGRAAAQIPVAASLVEAGPAETAAVVDTDPSQAEAAAVAQRYLVALLSGRWDQAAAQLDARELELLKAALRGVRLPGIGSAEALDALPATEVFVRLLRAVDARNPERFAGIAGARVAETEVLGPAIVRVRIELLFETEAGSRREVETLVARRAGDEWRLQLPGGIAELASGRR